jgi:hypothetical protein
MDHSPPARRSLTNRSAVTNGTRVLPGVDGRSPGARRYHDIVTDLSAEVGGPLSAAESLMVRNAATLQIAAEDLAAAQARGEPIDPDALARAANGAVRALAALKRLRPPQKGRQRRTLHDLASSRIAAE